MRARLWHLRHGGISQLREFERRRSARTATVAGGREFGAHLLPRKAQAAAGTDFGEWIVPDPASRPTGHRVVAGVIADPFTSMALSYEWHQVDLLPDRWKSQLEQNDLDLLFVESAWHGNGDAWQYQLTGSKAPSRALRALVRECRRRGIPTVFWNKEDPVHFQDFLDSARLFDVVFTTDSNRLGDYRRELGHDRVGVLPFAAQPALHNPIRPTGPAAGPRRDVAFAGTYFRHKYPERRQQMEVLLGGSIDAGEWLPIGLEIFSRFRGVSEDYAFPEPYASRVVGELSYEEMLTAYRCYKVFLNVNSVVDSPSMCARRIFEITACGTPVLSAASPAIREFFPPEEILQVEDRTEATRWVRALCGSDELRDRMVHLAQRRIWREHTYGARIDQVLTEVGLGQHVRRPRTVTAMVSTNRPHQLTHVIGQLAHQQDVELEVKILTHGFTPTDTDRSLAVESGLDVEWLEQPSSVSLGECYNHIITRVSGDVVAKIDDDDLYGPHYLFDQLAAMEYSGAEVVGKGAHHVHLADEDVTVLRYPAMEHTFSHFVIGPTIMASADLLRQVPFQAITHGEDSTLLRDVLDTGARIYSADRFGFIQCRSGSGSHTWRIEDSDILASSRVLSYGKAVPHVIF